MEILDTTLRDGAQCEGIAFSVEDKIKIIHVLDDLGVTFIEAGNPAASGADRALFQYAAERLVLTNAKLVAFGSTRRVNTAAERDEGLAALVASGAAYISLVGKAWAAQARAVLGVSPEENLAMIRESVAYLAGKGLTVFFDAEHFFDGYSDDPAYALRVLRTARTAGAARLILCDTNGGTLPERMLEAVSAARSEGDDLGVHCHNDAGLATACTLSAVRAGCVQAQGALNGYGERCGNANLCEVLPNLILKMGVPCLAPDALSRLTNASRAVGEIANLSVPARAPYVGKSAFAHKGGMHIDAMRKDAGAFEHIDPELVGNARRFLMSGMGGRGALESKLAPFIPGFSKESPDAIRLLAFFKDLEEEGYAFEDADASLVLRALGFLGRRTTFFEVLDFHVVSRKPETRLNAQAYVKARVDGRVEITADEGDGPVNALDLAVRKALSRFYPTLGRMRLVDFKVRVIDSAGTASKVRVHMESTGGGARWSTVGVSANVIEASLIALTDAIEYMLMTGPDPERGEQTWAKS